MIYVGRRLKGTKIIKILKNENEKKEKMYDLCPVCFKLLKKIVIIYRKRKGGDIIK